MHCQGNVREFQSVWRVVTLNTTKRYYGPLDKPFVQIGKGIVYSAVFEIVKGACDNTSITAQQIQKAIREGLNTIRLHHREVISRQLRTQHLEEKSDSSEPQYVEGSEENEDDHDAE